MGAGLWAQLRWCRLRSTGAARGTTAARVVASASVFPVPVPATIGIRAYHHGPHHSHVNPRP